ncbi:MAG: hypothetical protein PHI24_02590 [Desulfitobacteriaceae bacterium]|nr:hypothetical protein [Desulfitobacteriaceae bacterium]
MWPRRKLRLVTGDSSQGLKGVQTLLTTLNLEYDLGSWTEELGEDYKEHEDVCFWQGLFWPEVPVTELNSGGSVRGCLKKQTIQDFLTGLWEGEILIPLSGPTALWEERPLLWEFLHKAGFEPSLLWQNGDNWLGERGRGVIWIVPLAWLKSVAGEKVPGRPKVLQTNQASWRVRGQEVDFYADQDCRRFLGALPRWSEQDLEQAVYDTIGLAFNLGVSWFDLKQAAGEVWNSEPGKSPRCKNDDAGQFAGTQSKELPFTGFDNLENRWAG